MEVVLIICTILGGFAALWYFWEKFTSKKPNGEELEPEAASKSPDLKKPSALHGDMDEKNTVETGIKLPIRLRQNYDDLESMLKSNGVQLIRFPDRKVTAHFNGHTISYHRPKRAKKLVKECFLKEIESFLKRGGELI